MTIWLHKFLPHHLLSRCLGWLADQRWHRIKDWAIYCFIRHYNVNMQEADPSDYREYETFNDFFTRPLKKGVRPMPDDNKVIVSPVDGSISEIGRLTEGRILQAKGKYYHLLELFGGDDRFIKTFQNGWFLTTYLAPRDYHRFHMPFSGRLLEMIHVPGRLFSVSPASINRITHLFGRNERVICVFDTTVGPMAVIAVGAMIVGGIATVWSGLVTPPSYKEAYSLDYRDKNITLERGEEMGYFQLGSTVIVLFSEEAIEWENDLQANNKLCVGKVVGRTKFIG